MNKKILSEIQIIPVKPRDGLLAFCSFVLYEALYCGSVAIFSRPAGGYRLLYPTKKTGNRDINLFHPINSEIGRQIEKEVINKYQEVMNKSDDRYNSSYI